MEIWRDIEGFDGYQISNEGRVRSFKRGKEKILKAQINKGYLQLELRKNGVRKKEFIHRLVAQAFIPNPQNLPEVNHKDENKTNNCVENLEWCDRKYNVNYGTGVQRRAKKQSKCVDQIDAVTGEIVHKWKSTLECGKNGYNYKDISHCCLGLRKTHKGYIWKYAPM